jgi:hypothetical protein
VVQAQVVGDRLGAGVDPEVRELFAERTDLVFERIRRAMGHATGCSRARRDRGSTRLPEPADHLGDVALGHPKGRGDLSVAATLDDDRVHQIASQIHRRPPF